MNIVRRHAKKAVVALFAVAVLQVPATAAHAATFATTKITPNDPTPGATQSPSSNTYDIAITSPTASAAQCLRVYFGADASFAALPTGMTITSPAVTGSTAIVPGTWSTVTTTLNYVEIKGGNTAVVAGFVRISGLHNATAAGAYYGRIRSFTDVGCSTQLDSGDAAFSINAQTTVAVDVDESLTFGITTHAGTCNGVAQTTARGATSSGTAATLGRVDINNNAVVAQDLSVATNALTGYTVFARYSGALTGTSGSIADLGGGKTNAAPGAFTAVGTESFGYTTSDVTLSGTANRFNPTSSAALWAAMTTSNAEVMYSAAGPALGTGTDLNCVGYQVGVSPSTKAGSYATTVTYTAVPVF